MLDRGYMAPQVRIDATGQLSTTAALLHGLVQQRARALAARMGQLAHGVSEWADFLMLQTLNRAEPVLRQYALGSHVHPPEFHLLCAQLAGELATFGAESRHGAEYPLYAHDDLRASFAPLIEDLRRLLSAVLERNALQIELVDRGYGVRTAVVEGATDIDMLRALAERMNHPVAHAWDERINSFYVQNNYPSQGWRAASASRRASISTGYGIEQDCQGQACPPRQRTLSRQHHARGARHARAGVGPGIPGRAARPAGDRVAWQRHQNSASDFALRELTRILPRMSARTGMSPIELRDFLDSFRATAVCEPGADNPAQARASGLRDPNDVPILATLIAAGADCLVSGDKDPLAVADRYAILTPADFCARHAP